MRRHQPEEAVKPEFRYHTPGAEQLFTPIPFAFVTKSMCDEIMAERALILQLVPAQLQVQQRKLLDKYDPTVSADAFYALLRLFAVESSSS
ncbi:MAG: hypothetical protein WBP72_02810 [Rhodocyclaceae bacterium]